jgi:AraC-like DNA-binding protein
MFYQKVSPALHLHPFVECFFVWENEAALAQPLRIESPPTGFASMVFTYGDPYRVRTEKQTSQVPGAFLTGQATHQYELELSGRIGMIGIVFKPAGLSSLFGLPMYEFTDERTALTDVLGASITDLYEQINLSRTAAERVTLLEQFLNRRLLRQENPFDRTDYAANLIVEQRGILPISALIDDLYVCRRQFERQFLHKVGISPKYYARVRRVGYLCAQLATQRWQVRDWQDMIFRAGYYDQSHFIREFSQITGKRPTLYLKDNVELTRFLD